MDVAAAYAKRQFAAARKYDCDADNANTGTIPVGADARPEFALGQGSTSVAVPRIEYVADVAPFAMEARDETAQCENETNPDGSKTSYRVAPFCSGHVCNPKAQIDETDTYVRTWHPVDHGPNAQPEEAK